MGEIEALVGDELVGFLKFGFDFFFF